MFFLLTGNCARCAVELKRIKLWCFLTELFYKVHLAGSDCWQVAVVDLELRCLEISLRTVRVPVQQP